MANGLHFFWQRNYSSTLRGLPSDLKNGSLTVLDTLPRRNSLMPRLRADVSQANEKQESPAERFLQDWLSRPADLHSLLLPQLLPSHLPLWKLYFLRWVPEARIPNGGPITTFHKFSVLVDEIEFLQNQLRQYTGAATPACSPSGPQDEPSKMYFRAGLSPSESSAPPEYLSSSFPFSPVGNLCRRSILGTPLSKFLNGARIWLSTETLANENLWKHGAWLKASNQQFHWSSVIVHHQKPSERSFQSTLAYLACQFSLLSQIPTSECLWLVVMVCIWCNGQRKALANTEWGWMLKWFFYLCAGLIYWST